MLNRPDATAALAAFPGPVSIVVGEEDTLTPPAEAASMAAAAPGAALTKIPGAGHISNLEAPDAFNAAMQEWLRSVARVAPGVDDPAPERRTLSEPR
jgi:pimeloyl-ACP methyl ester carboxylesterase